MSKYTRAELHRIEQSLRQLTDDNLRYHRDDVELAADFLAETVAVLDLQAKARRDRAAAGIIAKRKTARAGRHRKRGS